MDTSGKFQDTTGGPPQSLKDWGWGASVEYKSADDSLDRRSSRAVVPRPVGRKRNAGSAQLDDDFSQLISGFERKLRVSEEVQERLKVADHLLKESNLVLVLMKSMPEAQLRKMAMICTNWRNLAYQTLRERKGDDAFSLMWISELTTDNDSLSFSFNSYFHPNLLGAEVPAEGLKDGDMLCSYSSLNRVQLILTYGTHNLSEYTSTNDLKKMEGDTMFPHNCVVLYVFSSTVSVSSPDKLKLISNVLSDCYQKEFRLFSSLLFPASPHLTMECFLIPSDNSKFDGKGFMSRLVGFPTNARIGHPKVLVMYQYVPLQSCEFSINDLLQYLGTKADPEKTTLVTGIYDYVDGKLGLLNSSPPVAHGLLIFGDEFSKVEVVRMLLGPGHPPEESHLTKLKGFYENFRNRHVLLFYHNDIRKFLSTARVFEHFICDFREALPSVQIHGIGSMSGPHLMTIGDDCLNEWDQLNLSMPRSVATGLECHAQQIVLVLLAYNTN